MKGNLIAQLRQLRDKDVQMMLTIVHVTPPTNPSLAITLPLGFRLIGLAVVVYGCSLDENNPCLAAVDRTLLSMVFSRPVVYRC